MRGRGVLFFLLSSHQQGLTISPLPLASVSQHHITTHAIPITQTQSRTQYAGDTQCAARSSTHYAAARNTQHTQHTSRRGTTHTYHIPHILLTLSIHSQLPTPPLTHHITYHNTPPPHPDPLISSPPHHPLPPHHLLITSSHSLSPPLTSRSLSPPLVPSPPLFLDESPSPKVQPAAGLVGALLSSTSPSPLGGAERGWDDQLCKW